MKDQLFLLRPGFYNEDKGPFYCGDSVSVEGLLGFFPELRQKVDVHYIDFQKPRNSVVELIGRDNQSIPVLVLASDRPIRESSLSVGSYEGKRFINSEADIRKYLSSQYDVAGAG